tara:strand:- start:643 stop:1755 length:1113 start_codon:yes stop_codon:yes gene_type:complete
MYSTTAYLYQQVIRVLTPDTSGDYFNLRYMPVYAKKLTINKGVDNVVLFEFINQDEKPVNITGSTLTFRIVNQNGNSLLAQKEMTIINAASGRAKVTLTPADLAVIEAQPASYSIMRASGNLIEAVFTDADAGARAPANIVDSIYPEFIPSTELTIPTVTLSAQTSYGSSSGSQYPDWASQAGQPIGSKTPYQSTEYYSSHIEPRSPVTSIQMDLIGYTGTIKAQAAETYQSVWYNVTPSTQYLNATETIHMTVVGWHPLLRLCFNNSVTTTGINGTNFGNGATANAVVTNGVVTSVSVTSPGYGYQAPPLIEFIGEGAGATATSTIGSSGEVTGITLVSGGSGYRPNPYGMVSIAIAVSTGHIENIKYR